MNYCLLVEAWGNDHITNNYDDYMKKNNHNEQFESTNYNHPISTSSFTLNDTKQNIHTLNQQPIISCNDILLHIKKCQYCRIMIKNELDNNINQTKLVTSNTIIDDFYKIIDKNKELILLILIGISIILFFNLINNLTN
jgi:hypothetical protein